MYISVRLQKVVMRAAVMAAALALLSGLVAHFYTKPVLGSGGITKVQSAFAVSTAGNSLPLAFANANTPGNAIIVTAETDNSSQISIGDSAGNTYTRVKNIAWNYGQRNLSVYYAINIFGGSDTVTLTSSIGGGGKQLQIFEYSGLAAANVLDQYSFSTAIGCSNTCIVSPSITTTQPNELLFAAGGPASNAVPNAGSGYSLEAKTNSGGPSSYIASEDEIIPAAGAYQASLSFTPQPSAGIILVSFIAAPTGPDLTPPSVPTNPAATAVSSSQINLTWTASTDNAGVIGYQIFRNGTEVATSTATSYADTGLTSSTPYSYNVAAFDAAGNVSGQSDPANATTQVLPPDLTPPSVPTNPAATAVSSSQINLTWTASTDNVGVIGYQIFRNGSQVATSSAASYIDAGLASSTLYSYNVAAFDAAGNISGQSATASATTPAPGPGTSPPLNTWTKITGTGGWPAEALNYDKSEYVASRDLDCIWGAYKQSLSSEPNNALVCYSYPENRWDIMGDNGLWHGSHAPSGGHSVSIFTYVSDKDSLVFQSDGSGSNTPEEDAGHWWWYDMGSLSGQDHSFAIRPWLGATTPWTEALIYDSLDKKLFFFDISDKLEICDPNTNACSFPAINGPKPPTGLTSPNMVYDSANDSMYFYGGGQPNVYTFACATAACATVNSALLTTTCRGAGCINNAPATRMAAGMAYSTQDNVMMMIGGIPCYSNNNPACATDYDDTWIFNPAAASWTQLSPANAYYESHNNFTSDRLIYDAADNIFLYTSLNAYSPTMYAFAYSPAQNYGRIANTYTPPAGSLNRVQPTAASQSWAFSPAIASAGGTAYLGWVESGANNDLSPCGTNHHPYIQSISTSTWTYYPGGSQAQACIAIDPEASGGTENSDLHLAVVNGTLWETQQKWNNSGSLFSQAWAKYWTGTAWSGGEVGCYSGNCNTNVRQNPESLIAVGNTPTLAVIEWSRSTYSPEGYLYVTQYNGSTWTPLGGKLNAAGSGTQVEEASLATDGANPVACWSEQVVVNRNSVTTAPQIHCAQWNGSAWVRWDSTSFNFSPTDWASYPAVTYAGGSFYVAWTERSTAGNQQLYACRWNGASCNMLGGGPLNINGAASWAAHPSLATDGANVYLAWDEQPSQGQHALGYVAQWNGSSWSQLGGALNQDLLNGSANDLSISVVGGEPTVVWDELTYGNLAQIYAKQWNGSAWVSPAFGWGS